MGCQCCIHQMPRVCEYGLPKELQSCFLFFSVSILWTLVPEPHRINTDSPVTISPEACTSCSAQFQINKVSDFCLHHYIDDPSSVVSGIYLFFQSTQNSKHLDNFYNIFPAFSVASLSYSGYSCNINLLSDHRKTQGYGLTYKQLKVSCLSSLKEILDTMSHVADVGTSQKRNTLEFVCFLVYNFFPLVRLKLLDKHNICVNA